MAIFDAFIGPSATSASVNQDAERTVNLYAEATESGQTGKSRIVLLGTPGLTLFSNLPTAPVRGLWANDTNLYAVAGAILYDVFSDGTYHARGNVGNDNMPVQIFPNGNSILIVSAGIAYIDSGAGPVQPSYGARTGTATYTNASGVAFVFWVSGDLFDVTLVGQAFTYGGNPYTVGAFNSPTEIVLTATATGSGTQAYSSTYDVVASNGAFLDGYFIVSQPVSKQFNFWSLADTIGGVSTWDPTNYASKEGYPDHIAAILADHEELWLFGTDTTEVWQDTGVSPIPFDRISGGFIHHGCVAKWSPSRLQNGVAWLSSDPARGGIIAYLAQGFTPTRISTHAVETAWDTYSTVADAVSYTYTEQGHEFWVINFPTGNATWVFDATSGWWHERGFWNGASLDRQRQSTHAYVFGQHLVGDYGNTSGAIYTQSLAAFTDNGTQINRIRAAPHLSTEELETYYSRFQLDMELGQSLTTPTVYLDWSDDGGHTFVTPVPTTPTAAAYYAMIVWRRLGKGRNRVFRITITDAVKIALIRAILDFEQGTR